MTARASWTAALGAAGRSLRRMRPVVRAVLVLLLAVTAWSASHGATRGAVEPHPVAAISSVATTDAQATGEDVPAEHPTALPA